MRVARVRLVPNYDADCGPYADVSYGGFNNPDKADQQDAVQLLLRRNELLPIEVTCRRGSVPSHCLHLHHKWYP